jgi:hypothetical protein
MPLRYQVKRLSVSAAALLRKVLDAQNSGAPSVTSLARGRKLTPIDDVVARVGREPFAPD